jgi:polysaccharide deacetylase 2 family uncharacterized protein YibQ
VGSNQTRTARNLLLFLGFCVGALLILAAGCDNLTSKFHSLKKSVLRKKEQPPSRAPGHSNGGPKMAIILDDLGSDPQAAEAIFALRERLTVSVLPFHAHSTEIAEEAKQHGFEVMLHMPMQAVGNELPEPRQLHGEMTQAEVAQELGAMLANVPAASGVNNHEGSQATADARLMTELMPLLKQRSLYFIDSRTTAATVAFEAAQRAGLRCGFRNVPFLDDVEDVGAIRKQLELAIQGAQEKGRAIAIGHPHKETLEALREMLPKAEARGVHLVFVSELLKQ